MKVNTIPSEWMYRNSMRLDSTPYLMGAFEARMVLDKLQAEKLSLRQVTAGHNGGIYNGPQFVRNYVDEPEYGVPFVTGSSMLQADQTNISLLSKKDSYSNKLRHLELREGMTLISCSGTIGRMVYSRADFGGIWASQDVLKVVPDPGKISSGYLYAYLNTRFGVPQILAGEYGAVIRHLEPEHITELQVPRLGHVEEEAHNFIEDASRLRTQYQQQIRQATDLFFESVGLVDISSFEWHRMGRDLGFVSSLNGSTSLRALNFNARYRLLVERLSSVPHQTLGEICRGGRLSRGDRFKRVDSQEGFGAKLIGQKEIFWLEPEGRWISTVFSSEDIFVEDETILLAAQGTLGENEVYCRVAFVTGEWTEHAYSEHLMRVIPNPDEGMSSPVLFAFLRSETAFRCLRSMSASSKQQEPHPVLLRRLPVPIPPTAAQLEIQSLIRRAYSARHEASRLEKAAIELIENTIQEEADAR